MCVTAGGVERKQEIRVFGKVSLSFSAYSTRRLDLSRNGSEKETLDEQRSSKKNCPFFSFFSFVDVASYAYKASVAMYRR